MSVRAPRALLLQPLALVGVAVRVVEDPVRVPVELLEVALPVRREPAHRDAAHPIEAFRVLVLPGDVVARARRQHLDVVARRETFGDEPAVVLGAAENVRAVPLDDERDFHRGQAPAASLATIMRTPRRADRCPRRALVSERLEPPSLAVDRLAGERRDRRRARRATRPPARDPSARTRRPPRPSSPGTAASPYARTGTPAAIDSRSGTQKPSCSLSEM